MSLVTTTPSATDVGLGYAQAAAATWSARAISHAEDLLAATKALASAELTLAATRIALDRTEAEAEAWRGRCVELENELSDALAALNDADSIAVQAKREATEARSALAAAQKATPPAPAQAKKGPELGELKQELATAKREATKAGKLLLELMQLTDALSATEALGTVTRWKAEATKPTSPVTEEGPYACSSCAHGKPQPASDTGWECTRMVAMACKPWTQAKHHQAKAVTP